MTNNEVWEKFGKDLKLGQLGERTLAYFFNKKFGYNILGYNYDKFYDLKLEKNNVVYTFEIKTDRWEYFNFTTNNVFIEISCKGKPSGLYATTADIMAFFFPDDEECFFIPTKELKKLIDENPHWFKKKDQIGDNGWVVGYTFNRVRHRDKFKVIRIPKHKLWVEKS